MRECSSLDRANFGESFTKPAFCSTILHISTPKLGSAEQSGAQAE